MARAVERCVCRSIQHTARPLSGMLQLSKKCSGREKRRRYRQCVADTSRRESGTAIGDKGRTAQQYAEAVEQRSSHPQPRAARGAAVTAATDASSSSTSHRCAAYLSATSKLERAVSLSTRATTVQPLHLRLSLNLETALPTPLQRSLSAACTFASPHTLHSKHCLRRNRTEARLSLYKTAQPQCVVLVASTRCSLLSSW